MLQIEASREGEVALVRLGGRLDRERAEHLSAALAALLQDGARVLEVDFRDVTYVSTAGTRVLEHLQEELAMLRGRVSLVAVTPPVREMLVTSGWDPDALASGRTSGQFRLRQSAWYSRSAAWTSGIPYETANLEQAAPLTCRLHGRPGIHAMADDPVDTVLSTPPAILALGVGAIGTDWNDGAPRLGELIAVSGAAACFPTDGSRRPDYLVAAPGKPTSFVLGAGISCQGDFSRLIRFSEPHEAGDAPLSELAAVCLHVSGGERAGVVIAAESTTTCGARLRRSPAIEPMRFDVPSVRDWIAFGPEQQRGVSTVLIAGVIARQGDLGLGEHLRPLGDELLGHLNAAVLSYTPMPNRTVDLAGLVRSLFHERELMDVRHLLWDDRGEAAVRETALMRGVAWVAPITAVLP